MGKAKWLLLALALILIPTFTYAQVYDYLHPRKDSFGYVGTADETYKEGHFEQFIMPEITDPGTPGTNIGWLYVADDTGVTKLYFETSAGATAIGPSTVTWGDIADPTGDSQIDFADNEITVLTFADTNEDMFNIQGIGAFGDVSVVRIEQVTGDPTDGTVLEVVAADDNVDPLVISASNKANALVVGQNTGVVTIAGVAEGTAALVLTKGDITITDGDLNLTAGDATFGEDVTIVGVLTTASMYIANVVAAAGSNTPLTLNAHGSGTISLGDVSTGDIIIVRALQIDGSVTIGDAAADTITVTGTIVSNIAIDDGVTDSPTMTFQDATNETAVFHKADASDFFLTLAAGRSLQILTGNLKVGNNAEGHGAVNGEDLMVSGQSEFDGAMYVDGAVTMYSTLTQSGGAVLISHDSNQTIGIGTGSNNQLISIGGGSGTVAIATSDWDISATGAASNMGNFSFTAGAAASISLAADGDADDLTIEVTGAHNSSLYLQSAGTGADAIFIHASAGGVLIEGNLADANQIKLLAEGTVAGIAIQLDTTDGGISIVADGGANGDIAIDAESELSLVSADWGISTTGVVTKIASLGFDSLSVLKVDTVELSAANILDLKDTKITLIAAPGEDYFIEVVSLVCVLDWGSVQFNPEAADDITVEYETSGQDIVVIETTGWLDGAADSVQFVKTAGILDVAAASLVNKAVMLFNADGTDIAAGDSTVTIKVTYIVHKALL